MTLTSPLIYFYFLTNLLYLDYNFFRLDIHILDVIPIVLVSTNIITGKFIEY